MQPRSIRDNILETALALFEARGYAAVALRDIADELGTSKAAIYYHFPTKQKLVETLVANVHVERSAITTAIETGSHTPLREILRNYLRIYIEHQRIMTWLTNDMTVEIDRTHHAIERRILRDELLKRMDSPSGRDKVVRANSAVLLLHTPVWSRFLKSDEDLLIDLILEILGQGIGPGAGGDSGCSPATNSGGTIVDRQ